MSELYELSAVEARRRFIAGELSPVEHVVTVIARAEAVEPIINAFGDTQFEQARVAAAAAEARYRAGTARPLEGIAVAVKDEAEIAGQRMTNGSLLWQDYVSETTEPMVERLLDAGAIVHARSLTPEFSAAFWTSSRLWGVTRNPWNPRFDVGGSSGGSGASLAAGSATLATGSDIGGSIRVPASCNGVVGYKPPHGRVPMLAPWGLDQWCHLGPMARTVGDVALMYDVMAGFHPQAAFATRHVPDIGTPTPDVRRLRIAYSEDLGDWPTREPIRASLRRTADVLRDAGAIVDEVDVCIERDALRRASNAHCNALFAAFIADTVRGREADATPMTISWLETIARDPTTFAEGLDIEGAIWAELGRVFDRYDGLLCPTMCIGALEAGIDYCAEPLVVDGVKWDAMHDICPAEIFNPAGTCPVLNVPIGRDEHDVPIGLQIVARPYDDHTAFRIGARLEIDQPWPLVAEVG